ncbi:spirocyclase AveC family protein [Actinomadura scrupuli]|uniref:spirocyclase AveC family protein n=1 Tax=Actinomadura scrupuli TaxID=559629 RepID=UPI003D951216
MTTEKSTPALAEHARPPARRGSLWTAFWIAIAVAVLAVVAANARQGAVSDRIANPGVTGAPRPVRPLLGFEHWIPLIHIGTLIGMIALVTAFFVAWRRFPRHPVLVMALMTTLIVWQDPIMNWAPYAVYNPDLWHWPEDWPLASISPTVEPFVVFGYASFYLGPYFPAIWMLRRLQAGRGPESFVWRHPLISLALLLLVIGFVMDAILEISLVSSGMYIYSQVIPWGSVFTGTTHQFPLIWESVMVTFVMIPAGVLLYRDDTGRTVAEKLAQRARVFPARPFAGMFAVMFVIINVAYFAYGAGFGIIRATKVATSVACPWPYPEAKVYDPQGFYAKAGAPGPYSEGKWNTWMTAQPDGRPDVPTSPTGPCAPGKG